MPIWCYASISVWVGFEFRDCSGSFIMVDLVNIGILMLYTFAYALLAVPALPLLFFFWRPMLDKLRQRLLHAYFQSE